MLEDRIVELEGAVMRLVTEVRRLSEAMERYIGIATGPAPAPQEMQSGPVEIAHDDEARAGAARAEQEEPDAPAATEPEPNPGGPEITFSDLVELAVAVVRKHGRDRGKALLEQVSPGCPTMEDLDEALYPAMRDAMREALE